MSDPNYFNKVSKSAKPDYFKNEPTKKISNKHEEDIEKRSSGKRTPGSGNIVGNPGDVRDDIFLREAKATHGGGINVDSKWLKKICLEALVTQRIPLVELRFESQKPPSHKDWVMLPAAEFDKVAHYFRESGDS